MHGSPHCWSARKYSAVPASEDSHIHRNPDGPPNRSGISGAAPFVGKSRFLVVHLALEVFNVVVDIRDLLLQHAQIHVSFAQVADAFVVFLYGAFIASLVCLQF